jgi:isopenicillin N synthase-like dioxygenase
MSPIKVLSLQDYKSPSHSNTFIEDLGDALVDIGFFAIEDHGIDSDLIQSAYKQAELFFTQAPHIKTAYDLKNFGQRGYTAFGVEHAKNNPYPDLKEFWHVGRSLDTDHPLYNTYPKNVWPTPEFKEIMATLYQKLDELSLVLLEACSLYMGEKKDFLPEAATDGNSILRIIHYPPLDPNAPVQSIRAAAHEDINLITLLCESTASGLELLQRDGSWLAVPSVPGQIVVDAGDMLQNLTNGFYKSTTHRVVNPDNSKERRFSMPYFVHPRSEVDLSPHPRCIEKTGGEATFPNITAGAFLDQRLKEIGLIK